jgi:hypothetical protein
MKKTLLAWVLLGALTPGLRAAEVVTSEAALAFPTIQDGAGARAIALGSTYVGIDEGSDALLWNPAGLGAMSDPQVAEHHNSSLVGSTQDVAVLGVPLGGENGFGLSLNFENDGTFDGRDANGNETGAYSANAYGGSVGYGVGVFMGLYLGVDVKFEHETLASSGLNDFSGDLGALWTLSPLFSLGAAYTNLGPAVDGWPLDQGLNVGASSHFYKSDTTDWLAAVSALNQTASQTSIHFGLEDTLYQLLSLRAGYAFASSDPITADNSNALGWTFGIGLAWRGFSLDYAYVPLSYLGNMQRISLTYDFGPGCSPPSTQAQ